MLSMGKFCPKHEKHIVSQATIMKLLTDQSEVSALSVECVCGLKNSPRNYTGRAWLIRTRLIRRAST